MHKVCNICLKLIQLFETPETKTNFFTKYDNFDATEEFWNLVIDL